MNKKALMVLVSLCLLVVPLPAQIRLLHEFAGGAADGREPAGDLIIAGSTMYGMTSKGGSRNNGSIFKIQTDGTGYTLLHSFAGPGSDGREPLGSLILSGSTLFGMTGKGGTYDLGTVFRMETDGSGFSLLHSFAGIPDDGQFPNGSLILSGSTLYGVTVWGGNSGNGAIFSIHTDGSDFTMLHGFPGVYATGSPNDSLILSGSTLYGITYLGGDNHLGAVFKIQTNGSDFTILHSFGGRIGSDNTFDGQRPVGSLLLSGSVLYGMTHWGGEGGAYGYGVIFKVQTDGTGYTLLHTFDESAAFGRYPFGSLILCGSTLFGTTGAGGNKESGTIFNIETDGSGFTLQHQFAGGTDDGAYPEGSLLLAGSMLFGTTYLGGDSNYGVIFSLPLPVKNMAIAAERREFKAFSIKRHYARIQVEVENSATPTAYYCIERRKGNGDFVMLRTFLPQELQKGQFGMEDMYLDKDAAYTYRAEAYDASGQLVGIPVEKTI